MTVPAMRTARREQLLKSGSLLHSIKSPAGSCTGAFPALEKKRANGKCSCWSQSWWAGWNLWFFF